MRVLSLAAVAVMGSAVQASAITFVDYGPALGSSSEHHTWSNFTLPTGVSAGVSGNAGQWAGTSTPTNRGIAADDGSTTNQFYVPLTSAGVAANPSETTDFVSGGIYSFFSPTHYTVSSSTPLADTNTFVLQLAIASGTSGQFGGAPTDLFSAPVLTLTLADSSTVSLAANYSLLENSGPFSVPQLGLNTTLNTLGYQWNLASVLQPISSYSIEFQTAYHAIVFGADTTASSLELSSSVLTALPEPGTAAFGLMLIGGMFLRRNRSTVAALAA